jgi:hypothetical protein
MAKRFAPQTDDFTTQPILEPGLLVPGSPGHVTIAAMAPAAHAATHAATGGDAVTLTQAQITGLVADLAAKQAAAANLTTLSGATITAQGLALLAASADLVWDNTARQLKIYGTAAPLLVSGTTQAFIAQITTNGGGAFSVISPSMTNGARLTQFIGRQVLSKQCGWMSYVYKTVFADSFVGIGHYDTLEMFRVYYDGRVEVSGGTNSSLRVGASGTAITQTRVYTPTLTPTLIAGLGLVEQTFNVPGLALTDTISLNGPAPAAGTGPVAWRVSAVDTLAILFQTTAINLTPSAGTYRILAVRS